MALRLTILSRSLGLVGTRAMSSVGDFGSGAGKGGGSGGSIRESGGAFGKMEAAYEEQYFRKVRSEEIKHFKEHMELEKRFHEKEIAVHQRAEQLAAIKEHLTEEIDHHEISIKRHEEAINRHKERMEQLHHPKKDSDSD